LTKPCFSCKEDTDKPKYCSTDCARRGRGIGIVQSWLNGEISGLDKAGKLLVPIREHLISEADHKCTRCQWGKPNPVLGRPILCIHHRDGNNLNASPHNLVVLCYNCQTLTPTFGALNRGVTASPKSVVSRKKWD
jgi:hypothetical protein